MLDGGCAYSLLLAAAPTDLTRSWQERVGDVKRNAVDHRCEKEAAVTHPATGLEVRCCRESDRLADHDRSLEVAHLRTNPFVSVAYWDPAHEMVFADCDVAIEEDDATKQRVWDLFAAGWGPYGYGPHRFFPDGPSNPDYCAVRLNPTRIELSSLADRAARRPPQVWRRP